MAWSKAKSNRGRAGAAAMHAKYGKGHLTSSMLAADLNNLAKARAKRHASRGGRRGRRGGFKFPAGPRKPVALGNSAARRIRTNNYFTLHSRLPLGSHRIAYHGRVNPRKHRLTGNVQRFSRDISPGGFNRRTSWGRGRKHHTRRILKSRVRHGARVKHYRYRRRSISPR